MYRLLATLHWTPRARSIERLLQQHISEDPGKIRRMVDIGCGPGWLARNARRCGLAYLGVDPAQRVDRAVDGGRIECRDAIDILPELAPSDVVILNGVVHHLDDATMTNVLEAARGCAATIICDHRAEPSNHAFNRLLQRCDRGRFIRPWSYFQTLAGFHPPSLDAFEIKWLGVPIWAYFAGLYQPSERACAR